MLGLLPKLGHNDDDDDDDEFDCGRLIVVMEHFFWVLDFIGILRRHSLLDV